MTKHPSDEDRRIADLEFIRMGFNKESRWRISDINKDFELCNTYPRYLIVPSGFEDEDLESVAKFRYFRRIPTAVWRHKKNGCFIVRSSQPTVGWFGWFRSELDEALVHSYVSNTIQQRPSLNGNDTSVSEHANDNNNHYDLRDVLSASHHDAPGLSSSKLISVSDTSIEKVANGFLNGVTNGSRSSADISSDDGKSKERANMKLNSNMDHNDQNHELVNNDTPSPHDNAKDSANSLNSVTGTETKLNGDINGLANGLANDVKVTDLGHLQTESKSSSLSNLNGNNQSCIEGRCQSDDASRLPCGNFSDNSNQTSASADTTTNNSSTATSQISQPTTSKMLIIDARSYAAAMANRAKGGGCECSEYYQRCEVHFMNLANIHSIRKSYHAIRSVCEAYSEQSNNWVSFLDNSRWLHHISGLLKSALLVVDAIDIEEKSVLIHCSDGWDRTPQLVALAEIMLDSHYRTFDGFRMLIQREWLDFGHKFADRCGSNPCNEDPNERCPVFLQWLDCVQQLLVQYPKHFEFNSRYLDKLNRHTYSNIFCTFSYNSSQERILSRCEERIGSLWSYFDSARDKFRNENYARSDEILRPSFKVKDLHFWKEVYLPPVNHPKILQATSVPITSSSSSAAAATTQTTPTQNNHDNNKCSHDSLYIDGLARTVCR